MSINTDCIDFKEMSEFFVAKKYLLRRFRDKVVGTKKTRVVYFDNNAPVLLVSHIDTVQTPRLDPGMLTGAGFDDRLGCYLSYTLQNAYPNLFDVVWCDYEEVGNSTAQHFKPSHDYNFIVELDREGNDFVDYDLADDDFLVKFKETTNIEHSWGSFSDICNMDHINCTKINLGTGHQYNHSPTSTFSPFMCLSQMGLLLRFVEKYKDTHWPSGLGYARYYPMYRYNSPYSGAKYYGDERENDYMCTTPAWKQIEGECANNGLDINAVYYPCDFCTEPVDERMYDEQEMSLICPRCRDYLLQSGDLKWNPELDGKDPNLDPYDFVDDGLDESIECMTYPLFELWANCSDWESFCYSMHMDPDLILEGVGNIEIKVPVHLLLYYDIISYDDLEMKG